jgi:hypothetical protein
MKWSHEITAMLVVLMLVASPIRASASARGAAMAQARRIYQDQMKQQAAEQKAMEQAEQQAAAAEAAEARRKHDAHVKANRARIEKEAKHREVTIAKRKAENAAKDGSAIVKDSKTTKTKSPK